MNKRNIDLSGLLKGKERQYGVKVILEIIVENFPERRNIWVFKKNATK